MTTPGLDDATAELLAGSLREVLAEGGDLAAALAELGWAEVLADDPARATTLLFAEHGRALAHSRVLDDVLLAELAGALPAATGPRALLYPLHSDQPADPRGPLTGLLLGGLDGITEVVVPTALDAADAGDPADAGGATLRILPAELVAAATQPVRGFDTAAGWLTVSAAPAGAAGPATPAGEAWTRAVAAGRRALAAEIIGACEAALAIAVAHTSARVQYGRSIATFQAVRHRLAEAHVAVESLRSELTVAWGSAGQADGGAWAARLVKLRAGFAQAEVMRHAVQVCGAMGLSLESELHRFVARTAALDLLLGDYHTLAEQLGTELLAGAELEPVVAI
ncbi:acyl-CoA dehydrogenase family protein [Frankia sp. QA3]|uniref:acyl-CoA dehydrogenase family protein n=1 Tax=Frankia sp. QA3 TaxID=710111 RepID=UPI000269BF39|nr:acyl-CoA dehydrogenase family protein [Frankia sp. QA3]EIV91922.1 acyl-CoA dehydrogenase [Frankia sp. QA3]